MRVAIYTRVSTDMQVEEGHSLEAQVDRCKSYCVSQGWDIFEIYTEEGESAKDLDRINLKRLLQDAGNGLFDIVLVYRLDRLTRSVRDLHSLLDMFDKNNVKFRSVTEMYDTTTSMGKLFITLVAALAEWERGNLAERVRFGMEQLVTSGKWHGGPVPYGYTWDGETLNIVPEEARILRELRRIYMTGEGLRATTRILNSIGMSRKGEPWSQQNVWYVLDNPIYAGKMRYGTKKKNGKYATRKKEERVECIWAETGFPTIYTWEEYEEHTAQMKRREFYGHSRKREYWFSGVLRCGRCGATMFGRPYVNKRRDGTSSEPSINYICTNKANNSNCNMPLLKQVLAEKLIMDHIRGFQMTYEEISAAKEEENRDVSEITTQLEIADKELRELKARKKKWMYMFAEDLISEREFKEVKRDEEAKEQILNEHIAQLKAVDMGTSLNMTEAVLSLPEYWDTDLEPVDRKDIMQALFRSIVFECKQETGREATKGKFLDFYIKEVNFN